MELASKISENCKVRKRIHLTAEEKLKILNKVDQGRSVSAVALEHRIDPSSIRKWLKQRQNIQECSEKGPKIKHMRFAPNQELNEALKIWFEEMRLRGLSVSGPMLRAKAMDFHKLLGRGEKFSASEGWLDRWKKNFGIPQLPIIGEKRLEDTELTETYKSSLLRRIDLENLAPCQIFNANETGLDYKIMPSKLKMETCNVGVHRNRERITFMPCCNVDGSLKLPLLVIGKSSNPEVSKNLSNSDLPVYYTHQPGAWMSREIFEAWFKKEFVPRVTMFLQDRGLAPKALLILENVPSHPAPDILNTGDFKTLFLPRNVASLTQPMDQGILTRIRKKYRHSLLSCILDDQENNIAVSERLKSLSVKDALFWLSDAWDDESQLAITECWKALLPESVVPILDHKWKPEIDTETILRLLRRIKDYETATEEIVEAWLNYEDNPSREEPAAQEIISILRDENGMATSAVFAEKTLKATHVTAADAEMGANSLIQFFEQHGNASKSDIAVLKRLRSKIGATKDHI